jgi:hypothetical protein
MEMVPSVLMKMKPATLMNKEEWVEEERAKY